MFVDQVTISLKAGDGGNGITAIEEREICTIWRTSWWRRW